MRGFGDLLPGLAGEFRVSLKTEEVRNERSGKPSFPVEDWVNSANAGFKVAELLTKMNSRVLIFSKGQRVRKEPSWILKTLAGNFLKICCG